MYRKCTVVCHKGNAIIGDCGDSFNLLRLQQLNKTACFFHILWEMYSAMLCLEVVTAFDYAAAILCNVKLVGGWSCNVSAWNTQTMWQDICNEL